MQLDDCLLYHFVWSFPETNFSSSNTRVHSCASALGEICTLHEDTNQSSYPLYNTSCTPFLSFLPSISLPDVLCDPIDVSKGPHQRQRLVEQPSLDGFLAEVFLSRSPVTVIRSRRLRWTGHIARMVESISPFKILTGTPAGKTLLGSPRRRWGNNIRMHLKK